MLRIVAHFFSFVFHPLLMMTYMLVLLLLVNPYLFGVNNVADSDLLILLVFLSTFMIPAFSVAMMRFLGLIDSFQMESKQERIGPYIATGIFYLWMFRNLYSNPDIPVAFKIFTLGATIALFIAFFINLFSKISIHAVGMGGLLAMIIITTILFSYGSFIISSLGLQVSMMALIMLAIIFTGIVCTSRLILNAHNLQDIYGGLVVGFGAQFIALQILL
ncbi:MAG: hypothetical protein AAFP19_12870 [Bacteroidota bacterium]